MRGSPLPGPARTGPKGKAGGVGEGIRTLDFRNHNPTL